MDSPAPTQGIGTSRRKSRSARSDFEPKDLNRLCSFLTVLAIMVNDVIDVVPRRSRLVGLTEEPARIWTTDQCPGQLTELRELRICTGTPTESFLCEAGALSRQKAVTNT